MNKKYTYKDVYNIFAKENWKLLSLSYKDNKQSLKLLCNNNHLLKMRLNNFLTGQRCSECHGKRRLSLNIIKKEFENVGYKLLSEKYINSAQKLIFICNNNHKHSIKYRDFYRGIRCGICNGTHKYSLKQAQQLFLNRNYILLSKTYINANLPLKVKCDKGHITNSITLGTFLSGSGCWDCRNLNLQKEKHPRWNSLLTNEDRRKQGTRKKKYSNWVYLVFKQDNFTCQCCGEKGHGSNLRSHHLEGWHWCKELRYEVSNGVTLCKDCHNKFHKKFGLGWNTSEQFYKFLRSFK